MQNKPTQQINQEQLRHNTVNSSQQMMQKFKTNSYEDIIKMAQKQQKKENIKKHHKEIQNINHNKFNVLSIEDIDDSQSNELDPQKNQYIIQNSRCLICQKEVQEINEHVLTKEHTRNANIIYHKSQILIEKQSQTITELVPGIRLWNLKDFLKEYNNFEDKLPNYKDYIDKKLIQYSQEYRNQSRKSQQNICGEAGKIIFYLHTNNIDCLSQASIIQYMKHKVYIQEKLQFQSIQFLLKLFGINSHEAQIITQPYQKQYQQFKSSLEQQQEKHDDNYNQMANLFFDLLVQIDELELLFYLMMLRNFNIKNTKISQFQVCDFQIITDFVYFIADKDEKIIKFDKYNQLMINFLQNRINQCLNKEELIFTKIKSNDCAKDQISQIIKSNIYQQQGNLKFFNFLLSFNYVEFKNYLKQFCKGFNETSQLQKEQQSEINKLQQEMIQTPNKSEQELKLITKRLQNISCASPFENIKQNQQMRNDSSENSRQSRENETNNQKLNSKNQVLKEEKIIQKHSSYEDFLVGNSQKISSIQGSIFHSNTTGSKLSINSQKQAEFIEEQQQNDIKQFSNQIHEEKCEINTKFPKRSRQLKKGDQIQEEDQKKISLSLPKKKQSLSQKGKNIKGSKSYKKKKQQKKKSQF